MKLLAIVLFVSLFLPNLVLADFGCHFILNNRLASALDEPQKKISFRFTCRQDMSLIGISFFCEETKIPPGYKISIQDDEHGLPSSKPLEFSSITPRGGCWNTCLINNQVIFPGKVYHIVIEHDANRGGQHPVGIIDAKHFASISYGDHLNPFDPRDEKPDPQLNVLLFENGKWKVLNRQPLFAIHGSGSKFQGVPYDSFGELPIHGNDTPNLSTDDVLQGEVLHPHSGLPATGFAIRVRKQGHPTAPLKYRVYTNNFLQHITIFAFSGLALLPEQVTDSYQWVTIGIKKEDHAQSFPPECRYVVFQTDSGRAISQAPGCDDCYLISEIGNSGGLAAAADMSFDGGAHVSRESRSIDGGATWEDFFERDANVVILGPLGPPAGPQTIEAVPTPEPWFQEFTP